MQLFQPNIPRDSVCVVCCVVRYANAVCLYMWRLTLLWPENADKEEQEKEKRGKEDEENQNFKIVATNLLVAARRPVASDFAS